MTRPHPDPEDARIGDLLDELERLRGLYDAQVAVEKARPGAGTAPLQLLEAWRAQIDEVLRRYGRRADP